MDTYTRALRLIVLVLIVALVAVIGRGMLSAQGDRIDRADGCTGNTAMDCVR